MTHWQQTRTGAIRHLHQSLMEIIKGDLRSKVKLIKIVKHTECESGFRTFIRSWKELVHEELCRNGT